MSFLPDKENSVDVLHSNQHDYHTAGAQGRPLPGKSVTTDVRQKVVRKPLGIVNLQRPNDPALSGQNKDKVSLKSVKPSQRTSENDAFKLDVKNKGSDLKSAQVLKKSAALESSVDDIGATLNKIDLASTATNTAASGDDQYPEIEHLAFPSQQLEDDFIDLWSEADKPDSYLDVLLNWRPAMFSTSHTYNTPYLPSPPSLSSSPLNSESDAASPKLSSSWFIEPLSNTLPSVTLPDLSDDDDDDEKQDNKLDDDINKSIKEDHLYFSALY